MVRKREIIIGATILVIATLAFLLGWTNIFTVNKITVLGSPNISTTSEILRIAQIEKGEKMARIEPRKIESRLIQNLDWNESASISRNWLSREVRISLKARTAIASAGGKYVDQNGVLFTLPTQLTGAEMKRMEKLVAISANSKEARAAGIELYLALPVDFTSKIAKVVATSQSNFQLLQRDQIRVNWGANRDNALKIKIYQALLLMPENRKIKYMDLSNPIKPTVK